MVVQEDLPEVPLNGLSEMVGLVKKLIILIELEMVLAKPKRRPQIRQGLWHGAPRPQPRVVDGT